MGAARTGLAAAALFALGVLLAATAAMAQDAPANRWTLFVWMAADNDLEPQGIEDLKEMELGLPEHGVEIVVFVDRHAPNNKRFGDWSGGRLYRVRPHRDRATLGSELLREFGPVDSSDGKLLAREMATAFKRYPAERYGVVLWNHGGGWAALATDENNPASPGKPTGFTLVQVGAALRDGLQQAAIPRLEIVGFDMCLMAQLETAAELRDVARILVASQAIEPGTGWAYDRFLPALAKPDLAAEELGRRIVETFDASNREAREPISTLSVIDLDRIEPVLRELDAVIAAVQPKLPALWSIVAQSLFWAEGYATAGRIPDLHGGPGALASVDLVDAFRRMQANAAANFPATTELARFAAAAKAAVLDSRNSDRHKASAGLAVYAPIRAANLGQGYAETRLAKDTRWLSFLGAAHAQAIRASRPPQVANVQVFDAITGMEQERGGFGTNSVLRVVLRGEGVLFATSTVLRTEEQRGRHLVESTGFLFDTELAGERLANAREAADLMVPQYNSTGAALSMDAHGLAFLVAVGDRFAHATIDATSFADGMPQPKARALVNLPGAGAVQAIIDFDPHSLDAVGVTALVTGQDGSLTPRGIRPTPDLQIMFLVQAVYANDRNERVPGSAEILTWGKGPRLVFDLAPAGKYLFQVGAESIAGAGARVQHEFEVVAPDVGLMTFVHAARARAPHSFAGTWRTEAGVPFGELAPVADDPESLHFTSADPKQREALAAAGLRSIARIELRRMPMISFLSLDQRGAAKQSATGLLLVDPGNPDRIRIRTLIGRRGDPRGQSLALVRQPPPGQAGVPAAPAPLAAIKPGFIDPAIAVGMWRGRTSGSQETTLVFHPGGAYQQQVVYGPSFTLDVTGQWSVSGYALSLRPQAWSPTAWCLAPGQCQPIALGERVLSLEIGDQGRQMRTADFHVVRVQ